MTVTAEFGRGQGRYRGVRRKVRAITMLEEENQDTPKEAAIGRVSRTHKCVWR
jgi:hypothetical protein